jgi:hypothetical protein
MFFVVFEKIHLSELIQHVYSVSYCTCCVYSDNILLLRATLRSTISLNNKKMMYMAVTIGIPKRIGRTLYSRTGLSLARSISNFFFNFQRKSFCVD